MVIVVGVFVCVCVYHRPMSSLVQCFQLSCVMCHGVSDSTPELHFQNFWILGEIGRVMTDGIGAFSCNYAEVQGCIETVSPRTCFTWCLGQHGVATSFLFFFFCVSIG